MPTRVEIVARLFDARELMQKAALKLDAAEILMSANGCRMDEDERVLKMRGMRAEIKKTVEDLRALIERFYQ